MWQNSDTGQDWAARRLIGLFFSLFALLSAPALATPTNVIIVIGDGMGPTQEDAARAYLGGALAWDAAPYQGQMNISSAVAPGTDSAASASAMATGKKHIPFTVSSELDGTINPTSLEYWKARGKSTGLVTTSYIEDGTTAAFGAHVTNRSLTDEITDDFLMDSRPNVLFGSVDLFGPGISPARALAAGYQVATDRAGLQALDIMLDDHVSAQFGTQGLGLEYDYAQGTNSFYDTNPFLSEMTGIALGALEQDPDGFFLVVEHQGPDTAGHGGGATDPTRIGRAVFSTVELSVTVQGILDWIALRPDPTDTLLIVTADHDTGGLVLLQDNGAGNLPTVSWTTTSHTTVDVNAYAWGPNGQLVNGLIDNTDIFRISTVPEPALAVLLPCAGLALLWRRRQESTWSPDLDPASPLPSLPRLD